MDTNLRERRQSVDYTQTNVFTKGMDTDTSDVLLNSSQYRYAQNVRITTDEDGFNGELHTIDGTTLIKSLEGEQVLAFQSIRNLCVAILYKKATPNNEVDTWRIVKWEKGNTSFTNVFGPCSEKIWNGNSPTLKTLSTVLRWESDKNVKLYIADGIHELMAININGTVNDGTNDVYPYDLSGSGHQTSEYNDIFKQAFTYNASDLPEMSATISDTTGHLLPAMIQYCYRLYIENGPASDISPLTVPLYLYKNYYQGYNQNETTSKAVDLNFYSTSASDNIYVQIYRITYQQNGQLPQVDMIADQKFMNALHLVDYGDSLESVSNAEFLSKIQTRVIPKIIESKGDILFAANITDATTDAAGSFNFDARSYSSGSTYDGNDIFSKTGEVGSQIYTTQNVDFTTYTDLNKIGHKQFTGEKIDWDSECWKEIFIRGIEITGNCEDVIPFSSIENAYNNDTPLYVELIGGTSPIQVNVQIQRDIYNVGETTNPTQDIRWYSSFLSTSNNVDIIQGLKYRMQSRFSDGTFIGQHYDKYMANATILAITITTFDNNNTGARFRIHQDEQGWFNGVGQNINWRYSLESDSINEKYRSGEVYRFGIVLYDKVGRQSPVKWIADIQIPDYYDGLLLQSNTPSYYNYHIGIEFFVNIPKELGVSGYDIVRCERTEDDKYTLFQGIVGLPYRTWGNIYFNPGFFSMDKVVITDHAKILKVQQGYDDENFYASVTGADSLSRNLSLLMFACPEYCYNKTQIQDIIDRKKNLLQIDIVDRRDVVSYYKGAYDSQEATTSSNGYRPVGSAPGGSGYRVVDDGYNWVHSPVIKDVDHNNQYASRYGASYGFEKCLFNSGLAFQIKTQNDNKYLEVNTGVVNLQSRSRLDGTYSGVGLDGTFPQAQLEDTDYSRDVAIFFNWFGPQSFDYNESRWHENQETNSCFISNNDASRKLGNVSNVGYVTARGYNQFIEHDNVAVYDQSVTVGNTSFVNWSVGYLGENTLGQVEGNYNIETWLKLMWNVNLGSSFADFGYSYQGVPSGNAGWEQNLAWYPIGGGDDLLLFELNTSTTEYNLNDSVNPTSPRVYIANIKQHATPYSGYNQSAISNSKYYSVGNYVKLPDVPDNVNVIKTQIKIKGGDTFFGNFKYNALHWWYDSTYNRQVNKMTTIYEVPIESDVNLRATFGYLFRSGRGYTNGEYKIQNKRVDQIGSTYSQEHDSYRYNSGYSCSTNIIPRVSDTRTAGETNIYDTRINYSSKKTNNETIDSWLDFKSNNFLDVDTRFGQITDLKLFKDKLLFWQDNATGIISTNERTILQSTDDASIILGDGSVLQRFDYITQIYGQKPNQYCTCSTNDRLYWWDEARKDILQYTDGFSVTPLSAPKTVKNYLTKNTVATIPSLSYDVTNNEVICHVVGSNESLVYNDLIQQFTGVYTFSPIFYAVCEDLLYMIGKYNDRDCLFTYGTDTTGQVKLFEQPALPKVKFVVNNAANATKTFDIQTFGGKFYGGGVDEDRSIPYAGNEEWFVGDEHARNTNALDHLTFTYNTPLKQKAIISGKNAVINEEYDFRLTIPRAGYIDTNNNEWKTSDWGDRLRGKIMQVEISSDSNNSDFSLHYVTTKYRMSWN